MSAADERAAASLRRLVLDVLLPAYNLFDADASAALCESLAAESLRDGLPPRTASGGARTALAASGMGRKARQNRRVLRALFSHLRVQAPWHIRDESAEPAAERPGLLETNWLEAVYLRLRAIVPEAVWRLYTSCDGASAEDMALLSSLGRGGARLLQPHRQRGQLPVAMKTLSKLVIVPLCHVASFAVPSESALAAIAECGPIVEMGAGSGYWTALLQHRGVDVVAYDSQPPSSRFNNPFFSEVYCNVLRGDGRSVFEQGGDVARRRALLLIWPNNADSADNPHLCRAGGASRAPPPPVWDAECVASYLRAGGRTVVYVGEREERVAVQEGSPPDCGASASRAFQALLSERFELLRAVRLHTWSYNSDDLTVWRRREEPPVVRTLATLAAAPEEEEPTGGDAHAPPASAALHTPPATAHLLGGIAWNGARVLAAHIATRGGWAQRLSGGAETQASLGACETRGASRHASSYPTPPCGRCASWARARAWPGCRRPPSPGQTRMSRSQTSTRVWSTTSPPRYASEGSATDAAQSCTSGRSATLRHCCPHTRRPPTSTSSSAPSASTRSAPRARLPRRSTRWRGRRRSC